MNHVFRTVQPPEVGAPVANDPDDGEAEYTTPVVVAPPSPRELVDSAAIAWREALAATAGSSTLADVDRLGDAVLDLTAAHPSGLAQLLAGRPARLSNLVRESASLSATLRRARAVRVKGEEFAQRFGVAPAYLAIGIATWTEPEEPGDVADAGRSEAAVDGQSAPRLVRAPVLLRPASLRPRTHLAGDDELSLEDPVEINPFLARSLRRRGALLDPSAVGRACFTAAGFDPRPALDHLRALGAAVLPDFRLEYRLLVGTFVHPGQVLLDDLEVQLPQWDTRAVIAALAGDLDARAALARPLAQPVRGDRDPDLERGVGNLDPLQQHVLDVVASGRDVFLDAPVGADSAGTLAAIIADVTASGRSVLYVPGHRRAASAVLARLDALGLAGLALDIAPDAGWRAAVARRLLSGLTPEPVLIDEDALSRTRAGLVTRRAQLAGYVDALHRVRVPWNASAYDVLQELARLTASPNGPRTTVRLPTEVARGMTTTRRAELAGDLERAAALGAFTLRPSSTPWYGADLTTDEAAAEAIERLQRIRDTRLPALQARVAAVAADTGVTKAGSVGQWGEQLRMLAGVRGALDVFQPMIFERSAADMIAATADRTWRREHGATLGRLHRRRLRRQAKDQLRPGRPIADLHAALVDVQEQRRIWQAHCTAGGWPRLPDGLAEIEVEYAGIRTDLDALDEVLATTPGGAGLADSSFDDLRVRIDRLLADHASLATLPARASVVKSLTAAGLASLLKDLSTRHVPPQVAGLELDLAWWTAVFEGILSEDSTLGGYDGAALTALAGEFRALDSAHVASLSGPVLAAVRGHLLTALGTHPGQAEHLFAELVEGRFAGLRDAMARYPDVLARIRPCLVASPVLVPQVLPPEQCVDVLILDAVQHLPIESALAALGRARQVVVVGDPRRSSASAVRELSRMLPPLALRADATRRDPHLTEFLATHAYGDRLSPVPLPGRESLVRLEIVDGTGMPLAGQAAVESTRAEVERVVELVIDSVLTRPDESLAVVTVSAAHADRVRDAVFSEARDNPALAPSFRADRAEPFTVVDLTGVAGLSRDSIILSLGYGKTPHGRVLHRFGPLNEAGGDALLIDALGATRRRLTLVSCFEAGDLDLERLRGPGAHLMADLLAFAESRTGVLAVEEQQPVAAGEGDRVIDRLVADLAHRLERAGLIVRTDVGVGSGTRIPLAVGHPALPDELLVAVLTDDQAYVAEPSVRVRDRLAPQRLERLGWRVAQVWSAAAFLDPQAEADAIREMVAEALEQRRAASGTSAHAMKSPTFEPDDDSAEVTAVPAVVTAVLATEQGGAAATAAAEPVEPVEPVLERPMVEPGLPVGAYTDDQLDALVRWLLGSGVSREEATLAEMLRGELGLTRRGVRVDGMVAAAVQRALA